MDRLKPVAKGQNLIIHGYMDGFFSLSNSPFYGHHKFSAIDLYPNRGKYSDEVPSPVAGSVTALRKFSAPTSLYFERPKHEYVIVIANPEDSRLCYKILHADPCVSVGEKVEIGDNLGTFVKSGLFCFWTDPHIHVEIRDRTDPIRARGGYALQLITQRPHARKYHGCGSVDCISGRVIESKKEYVIIKPAHDIISTVNGYSGIGVRIGHEFGILDGGIPHYGYGGVLVEDSAKVEQDAKVCLGVTEMGSVTRTFDSNYLQFQCDGLSLANDSIDFRGISSYLQFHRPEGITLVYRTFDDHGLRIGQTLDLGLKKPPAKGF